MKIRDSERTLLEVSAKDLIKQLNENVDIRSAKQMAFGFVLDRKEEVQIQVVVTRCKNDFLEPFCTEETVNENYKP